MAVDRMKKVSITIREDVSFCGRRKLQNNARRKGVKKKLSAKELARKAICWHMLSFDHSLSEPTIREAIIASRSLPSGWR